MKSQNIGEAQTPKIQERNQRIRKLLDQEKLAIQDNLKKQFQNFMNRFQKKQIASQRLQQCYHCLANFIRASENLLSVYFPILADEDFISLQRQSQLIGRAVDLKSSLIRSFKSLCSKLMVCFQNKKKQEQPILSKKSSNTKTPFQYSAVLTQWLLRNFNNPYPTNEQKQILALDSGLSVNQVNNWFINSRERVIKKYLKRDGKNLKDTKQKEREGREKYRKINEKQKQEEYQ